MRKFKQFLLVLLVSFVLSPTKALAQDYPGSWILVWQIAPDWQDSNLTMVNVETGEERVVANSPEHKERGGVWSPDGTMILYHATYRPKSNFFQDMTPSLHLVQLKDGSDIILDGAERGGWVSSVGFEGNAIWSPDSKRIAHINDFHDQVQIYDLVSGQRKEYSFEELGSFGRNMSWSPDGETIVFSVGKDRSRFLVELDLETGEFNQLTEILPEVIFDNPRWQPMGQGFVYEEGRFGTAVTQLLWMDRDGSNRNLFDDLGFRSIDEATWSQDGSILAFAAGDGGTGISREEQVYLVNWESGDLIQLSFGPGPCGVPTWTATDWVAFECFRKSGTEIQAIRSDGTGLRRVIQNVWGYVIGSLSH